MSDFAGGVICGAFLMLVLAMVGGRVGGSRPTGDPTTPPPPPDPDKPRAARTRPSDRLIGKPPAKPGRPSTALIVHRNLDGTRQPIRGLE